MELSDLPPRCAKCGGLLRPGVVWFGEPLPSAAVATAFAAASRADVVLVVGTSGVVYPAAQLPLTAQEHGAFVVEINVERTPLTSRADAAFDAPAAQILPRLLS
jgi:NAD-dependent deacetylase